MTDLPFGLPLTNGELRKLAELLARYASHDLDQFEYWRLESPYGPVYLTMSRRPFPGTSDDAYAAVWPLPPHLQPVCDSEEGQRPARRRVHRKSEGDLPAS